MAFFRIKLALYLNFFVCAILLNSVGIVILQVINNYQVGEVAASILEACKDLTIALTSFILASYIPRIGYKKSMLLALLILILACIAMPILHNFMITKLLFVGVGISFALIKISVYSVVGLISQGSQQHASLLSSLEGVFQFGVLSGYWIFGYFIAGKQTSWLDTYWFLALIVAIAFILLLTTKVDESALLLQNKPTFGNFIAMLQLVKLPLVITFAALIFIYVFIEQGIQSWLPTFNNKVLHLPVTISVQLTSIFAFSIAFGRVFGAYVMQKIHWLYVISLGSIAAIGLILLTLPLMRDGGHGLVYGWSGVPVAAFILPLIGFFIAPIYPTLCSTVLSKLPISSQSAMAGLIVIFSALGGTIGSRCVSVLFARIGGQSAFYSTLIPIGLFLLLIGPYAKMHKRFVAKQA